LVLRHIGLWDERVFSAKQFARKANRVRREGRAFIEWSECR